eukprot:7380735-Prymnesium_polylepis.1
MGLSSVVELRRGEYFVEPFYFDNATAASKDTIAHSLIITAFRSQVQILGATGVVIRAARVTEPLLFTLARGSPQVQIYGATLIGRLRIEGGQLDLTDCAVEAATAFGTDVAVRWGTRSGGQGATPVERALSVVGGHVTLLQTILYGHAMGAISVEGARASLTMIDCVVRNCSAARGGALLIGANSTVALHATNLTDNNANIRGGAIHVRHTQASPPVTHERDSWPLDCRLSLWSVKCRLMAVTFTF